LSVNIIVSLTVLIVELSNAFFSDPAQGQNNGSFTKADHENFMKRMEEWKEKGYRVGASWGIFSMGIPHRVSWLVYKWPFKCTHH
jgi:hypothetical protein